MWLPVFGSSGLLYFSEERRGPQGCLGPCLFYDGRGHSGRGRSTLHPDVGSVSWERALQLMVPLSLICEILVHNREVLHIINYAAFVLRVLWMGLW